MVGRTWAPLNCLARHKSGFCAESPRLCSACYISQPPALLTAPSGRWGRPWLPCGRSIWAVCAGGDKAALEDFSSLCSKLYTVWKWNIGILMHQFETKLKASEENLKLEFLPKKWFTVRFSRSQGCWVSEDILVIPPHCWVFLGW